MLCNWFQAYAETDNTSTHIELQWCFPAPNTGCSCWMFVAILAFCFIENVMVYLSGCRNNDANKYLFTLQRVLMSDNS